MTNTHAQSKKRHWRGGAGGSAFRFVGARDPMAFLSKYRSSFGSRNGVDGAASNNQTVLSIDGWTLLMAKDDAMDDDFDMASVEEEEEEERMPENVSLAQALPQEIMELVLSLLDGKSLLACSLVCRTIAQLTYDRDVWRNICMKQWPTLQTQFLPQLPGAPDYDLIRLYGGCWRRCFVEQHRKNERAELRVQIPNFPALSSMAVEKIVSETFAIGEHHFCLWIFPNGNPNEQQYSGKVLSVYLVLTDLDRRPPSWLTCAVFSLSVGNHLDPLKRIEWHSCLVDNKFDSQLNNWGVHSLGALKTLKNPANGFLLNDTLTITAKVRLMNITFRVVRERDLKNHRHLGLTDLSQVDTIELPFCCTLQDLLKRLSDEYNVDPDQVNVWCFNQPVVSGQALRPRKLLTQAKVNKHQPMFGNLLCDGVDIDAYSFCQIYVESKTQDDPPLDTTAAAMMVDYSSSSALSLLSGASGAAAACAMEGDASGVVPDGYLFVKVMNPTSHQLEYVGRIHFAPQLCSGAVYECVAKRLNCASSEMVMYKEEIAPTVLSGPIPWSSEPLQAQHGLEFTLHAADIVIFTLRTQAAQTAFAGAMKSLLLSQYATAELLLADTPFATVPTLEAIESLAEKLDIPKFRVRSAFRKCREDGRRTLKYIMEGRHLGFICDSCGETDFKGPRFNCSMCTDYDLCRACNAQCHEVNHRYANVDGKWQRIYNFKDHSVAHPMREMMPVFYQYNKKQEAVNDYKKLVSSQQQHNNNLQHVH